MKNKSIAILGAILLAGAIAALVLFVQRSGTKRLRKITAGHLVSLDQAPLFVAKEAGYFEEEGLDVELRFSWTFSRIVTH